MSYQMQMSPQNPLQTPEQKQMGLYLHLSQFANLVFSAWFTLPIILWQTQKDKMPGIDAHGKMIVNWTISSTIYALASVILMFVLIGFLTILLSR